MLRQVVHSESLRSIGYDKRSRTLEIEFHGGAVYSYERVPIELWTELLRAESKGKFFQHRVRDRFPTTRL